MGFGKDDNTLMGTFDSREKLRKMKVKRIKGARKKFADQEVFGLTGRLVKRSKGFR